MSTQDYATARQQRYEDVWFTITGDDWPVPLHFLEKFADKIRAEQGESDARIIESLNAEYRDVNDLDGQRGFSVEACASIRRRSGAV